ncbi:UDP-N-acetylglucosamine--N-acetylmuramyl-(pentapeptide) pyrophosphoryl-undecaprenol N-acetylglucosamine transferase [Bifidobacterium vespertilionis]|uniref:UDP-N-acetylglucosamine--N-acetylmuramyl-(pentapeptide) pyrophosphoryl-undecaprenol N-acetylglucosamine transferase n=1 Tax=Bifidobacterium vespertilionis TaxID=2562524 RepID=A0A5J5E2H8_9BIFI|nr:UDP-N-acetylglucosamine--N-acetylmuramyl-(pentapeptide) pyrophosphoryl-undecaprenol N-acetylglucosamine transferase [Bifidobacterium vespertilionis]KAA8821931.1 UDP-N-acetylglucosamine--N-acetylmuramyl-(pentapeptide) pyrophosphoryl-undecaprenol N-acetylglucosamine transferase [Bifidobacterium vespertilionis]KAA8823278.1 UDP-N-acetylglucosamine--N-acetylmuramyl-(pentapeptide) pyrophosphoryl-undecaprenol N-acetylglucosamine transferase [Bifidobacterium vespertilionis]
MSEKKVHVVLAGGGTAGHVNPLLSVANAIKAKRPDAVVTVLGGTTGLENQLVPAAGFEMDTIEKVPFPRSINAAAFRFPFRWTREVRKVKAILTARQADVVCGFGGYISAPVYRAAKKMGLPMAIHEQNARAGMANKLGARWADYIGTAYENTGLKPGERTRVERVGLPLRPAIASLAARLEANPQLARVEAASQLGVDPTRPLVLVTGGSLGAQSLNEAVASSARQLLAHAQVVHLTGRGKLKEVRELVAKSAGKDVLNDLGIDHVGQGDYHAVEYLERIDLAFACADLVICRSGAGSVSEIAALGLPAVYVPLPIGNGEQRFNAQPVVEAGGGIMVSDADFTTQWVLANVPSLLADHDRLSAMGKAAWGYGIRDAADVMADRVLSLIR